MIGACMLAHAPGRLTATDLECMQETIRHLEFQNAKWDRSGFVRF